MGSSDTTAYSCTSLSWRSLFMIWASSRKASVDMVPGFRVFTATLVVPFHMPTHWNGVRHSWESHLNMAKFKGRKKGIKRNRWNMATHQSNRKLGLLQTTQHSAPGKELNFFFFFFMQMCCCIFNVTMNTDTVLKCYWGLADVALYWGLADSSEP